MNLNYQHEVLVLPGAVLGADADGVQLRVLLWLASDLSLANKHMQLAKLANCKLTEVKDAIRFWISKGVLTETGEGEAVAVMASAETADAAPKSAPGEKKTLLQRADELPQYTTPELEKIMEARAGLRELINEAQNMIGKIFNTYETNILVGMVDYLGMTEEAVLLLLAHCKRIDMTKLRAIEKYAYELADRELLTPAALEEEFRTMELMHSFEGEVRKLFGMKSRSLTKREKEMLRAWVSYGYGIEIVSLAYDMTVTATNEPSAPYTHAILKRWHEEGLKTLADIQRAEEEKKAQKAASAALGNSFETDDFFKAALERSFSSDPKQS